MNHNQVAWMLLGGVAWHKASETYNGGIIHKYGSESSNEKAMMIDGGLIKMMPNLVEASKEAKT